MTFKTTHYDHTASAAAITIRSKAFRAPCGVAGRATQTTSRVDWVDCWRCRSKAERAVKHGYVLKNRNDEITAYGVLTDNGHSSDVLPGRYESESAAWDVGIDWLANMLSIDPDGEGEYDFDVVEVPA